MNVMTTTAAALLATLRDVLPILVVIVCFQLFVLRRPIPRLPRVLWGSALVVVGLSLFLMGLELALFPLGEAMAEQLAEIGRGLDVGGDVGAGDEVVPDWRNYGWTYLFAFAIGVSTTLAEPALIAVGMKAEEVSGGAIRSWGLRLAVAFGVGFAVSLGTLRIVFGIPLPYVVLSGYLVVVVQTYFAPKEIIPLAYDSGGVTTSTVTVPLVAALGLGLATQIPGRDPMVDGFGLIALASLFPIMTVMGYAQFAGWWNRRRDIRKLGDQNEEPQCTSN